MKNKVFEYTVPKDCTVKIEQSENSFVVLIEPLKHIPKEGDFVRYKNKYGTGYFVCGGHSATSVKQKQDTYSIFSNDGRICVYDALSASIGFPISTNIFETISKDEFCKSINDLGCEYNFETNEIETLKWQPKEDDEVHRVIFDRDKNKFIIHSFTWIFGCKFNDCIKPSIKEAQQLCDKLNEVLNEK